jgi:hypothetical protein
VRDEPRRGDDQIATASRAFVQSYLLAARIAAAQYEREIDSDEEITFLSHLLNQPPCDKAFTIPTVATKPTHD